MIRRQTVVARFTRQHAAAVAGSQLGWVASIYCVHMSVPVVQQPWWQSKSQRARDSGDSSQTLGLRKRSSCAGYCRFSRSPGSGQEVLCLDPTNTVMHTGVGEGLHVRHPVKYCRIRRKTGVFRADFSSARPQRRTEAAGYAILPYCSVEGRSRMSSAGAGMLNDAYPGGDCVCGWWWLRMRRHHGPASLVWHINRDAKESELTEGARRA